MKKTEKEIRDEAMKSVMWKENQTNNDVTRYIADAVAEKVVRDERDEANALQDALPYLKGSRELKWNDFYLEPDAADWGDDGWSYYLTMCSNVDEIFGTRVETGENADYINVYASVDPGYTCVDDVLHITLCKGDGEDLYFQYQLSETEKEHILMQVIEHESARLSAMGAELHNKIKI